MARSLSRVLRVLYALLALLVLTSRYIRRRITSMTLP
jgi:hypothetical protein